MIAAREQHSFYCLLRELNEFERVTDLVGCIVLNDFPTNRRGMEHMDRLCAARCLYAAFKAGFVLPDIEKVGVWDTTGKLPSGYEMR